MQQPSRPALAGAADPYPSPRLQAYPPRRNAAAPLIRRRRLHGRVLAVLLLIMLSAIYATAGATAQAPVVRAVLFYSPTCSHCLQLMREIPGIFERNGGTAAVWNETGLAQEELAFFQVYNGNLDVLMVNVSLTLGRNFYNEHTLSAGIPAGRTGVPRLAVADDVLVGSQEILAQLPGIIERGLAIGGTGWPDIPRLDQIIAATGSPPIGNGPPIEAAPVDEFVPEVTGSTLGEIEPLQPEAPAVETPSPSDQNLVQSGPDPASSPATTVGTQPEPERVIPQDFVLPVAVEPSMVERYRLDPVGNSLAVLVLVGMIMSVLAVARFRRPGRAGNRLGPMVPLLALIGIGVAAYLTYVETSGAVAVCGPVGNCNAVQQSEYARLFGLVPVGAVGLIGYGVIIVAWLLARARNRILATRALLVLGVVTMAGTLFSIYLTFLEPFVIGASCAWCLTSAVLITILMVLTMRAARAAWATMRSGYRWAGSDAS